MSPAAAPDSCVATPIPRLSAHACLDAILFLFLLALRLVEDAEVDDVERVRGWKATGVDWKAVALERRSANDAEISFMFVLLFDVMNRDSRGL